MSLLRVPHDNVTNVVFGQGSSAKLHLYGSISSVILFCALGHLNHGLASESPLDKSKLAALIDSLVSNNSAPSLVIIAGQRFPLFSEKYDWKDQDRVLKNLEALVKQDGNDLWPLLVQRIGDRRYCLSSSGDEDSSNSTVGDICEGIATADLLWAFKRHLPNIDRIAGRVGRPPELEKSLQDFTQARQGKSLEELQVEMCNWSLTRVRELPNDVFPEVEKAKFSEKIKLQIEDLEKTKTPVVGARGRLGLWTGDEFYDAVTAQWIRERYAEDKQDRKD